MSTDKITLVTGGTGFIGSWIVDELLCRKAPVLINIHNQPVKSSNKLVEVHPGNLCVYDECLTLCRKVHYVVHCAGTVGATGVGPFDMLSGVSLNLEITVNMLRAAWEAGIEKFILFGSSTGYPPSDAPQNEGDMWTGDPHSSYLCYGWMRRYLEKLGEFVESKSHTKIIVIRPTAVYGPRDNFSLATGHVIPSLIRRAVEKENPFVVWGTGNEVRDFV
ncbi:MAG: NAD-dependent epimerase/dehydratase family protein [Kiritimatiellae bacterium]|nr:NAD-dependent epimerase/dehydratase family protein [Kiritimatiellia bacterium]